MKFIITLAVFLSIGSSLWAADWNGTWASRRTPGMTMTVEPFGADGRRMTWHMPIQGKAMIMVVETPLSGAEVPAMVDGKPSGETMAITKVDDRHYAAIVKMNGQPFGTSKGELSVDGKTIAVDNAFQAAGGGNPAEKYTEIWDRK